MLNLCYISSMRNMVHFPATPVNFVLDLSQEGEMMQWGLKCHRILQQLLQEEKKEEQQQEEEEG